MQPIPAATEEELAEGRAAAQKPLIKRPMLWALFVALAFGTPLAGMLLDVGAKELPVYGQLPAFTLVDQDGQPFSDANLKDHVAVVDFIYTRCSSACPLLTQRMKELQTRLVSDGRSGEVQLVSLSVDPEHDSPMVLKEYAGKYGAETASWHFLTGAEESLKKTLVEGFRIAVGKGTNAGAMDEFEIVHGQKFVLVDRQGRIRGYYDVDDKPQLDALYADVRAVR